MVAKKHKMNRSSHGPFQVEKLEERILLSADPVLVFATQAGGENEDPLSGDTLITLENSVVSGPNVSLASDILPDPGTNGLEISGIPGNELHLTVDAPLFPEGFLFFDAEDSLTGSGPMGGGVFLQGLLSPGNSPGIQNVVSLSLAGGSTTLIEIGGVTPGPGNPVIDNGFDQINVSGATTLGGTLDINLLNSFHPVKGQRFDILNYGSVSGNFSSFSGLYLGDGLYFKPIFQPTKLTLEVAELPIPGLDITIADSAQLDAFMTLLAKPDVLDQTATASGSLTIQNQEITGDFSFTRVSASAFEVSLANVSLQLAAGDALLNITDGSGGFYWTTDGMAGSIDGTVALDGVPGLSMADTDLGFSFNTMAVEVSRTLTHAGDMALSIGANTGLALRGNAGFTINDLATLTGNFSIEAAMESGVGKLRIGGSNIAASLGDVAGGGLGISMTGGEMALLIADAGVGAVPKYAVSATGNAALHGITDGSLSGPLNIRLNTLGQTVDEVISNGVSALNLTFNTIDATPAFVAKGVTLDLGPTVGSLSGDLFIQATVGANSSELAIGVENMSAHFPFGGLATATLAKGRAALLLMRDDQGNVTHAFRASGQASLGGVDGLAISGEQLVLVSNATPQAIDRNIRTPSGSINLVADAGFSSLSGMINLDVGGLLTATGEMNLQASQETVQLAGSPDPLDAIDTDRLILAANDVTATLNAPGMPDWGMTLAGLDFGLAFVTEKDVADPRRWLTMAALPRAMTIAGLTLTPASARIGINRALDRVSGAVNDAVVDWSSQTQTIATDAAHEVVLDFAAETWNIPVSGTLDLLGETISGDFELTFNPADGVYEVHGENLVMSLDAGVAAVQISGGTGDFRITPDGVAGSFSASATLSGLDDVTLAMPQLTVSFNNTVYEILNIAANTGLNLSALGANLNLGDFIRVSGDFSLVRQVVDGVEKLLIGGANIDSFLGLADDSLGLSVSQANLALLVAGTEQGAGYALQANGIPSLNGFADNAMQSAQPLAIRINTLGQAVQEQISNGVDQLQLAFASASAEQTFLLENATFDLGDGLGSVTGDLRFSASYDNNHELRMGLDASNLTGSLALAGGIGVRLADGAARLAFTQTAHGLEVSGSVSGSASLTGLNGLTLDSGVIDLALDPDGVLTRGDITGALTLMGQSLSGTVHFERAGEGIFEMSARDIATTLRAGDALLSLTHGEGGLYLSESGMAGSIRGDLTFTGVPGLTLTDADMAVTFNTFAHQIEQTIANLGFYELDIPANTPLRLAGQLSFSLDGLADFSGEVVVEASLVPGEERLLIGGHHLTATVGDTANSGVAISLTDGQLALLIADDGDGVGLALDASGTAALHGVADGAISGPIQARMNTLGRAITTDITNGLQTVALNFADGQMVQSFDALGVRLDLGDTIGYIEGDLRIQGGVVGDRTEVNVGAVHVNGAIGVGPVAARLQDGFIGLNLVHDNANGFRYALSAGGQATLQGVDLLTLDGDAITIAINNTGAAIQQTIQTTGDAIALDLAVGEKNLQGLVSMNLGGILAITGDISIGSLADTVKLADGSTVVTDRLNVIGNDLAITLHPPGVSGVDITLANVDLALAFLQEHGVPDARRWMTMNALPGSLSILGHTLTPTSAAVELNRALAKVSGALNATVVDWSGAQAETMAIDGATDVVMDFAGDTWRLPLKGELDLFGEKFSGDFIFQYSPASQTYTATVSNLTLSLAAGPTAIVVTNGNGSLTMGPNGVVVSVSGGAALTGLDGVTFTLPTIALAMNTTAADLLGVPAGTSLRLAATDATLKLGDFIDIGGDFAISRQVIDGVEQVRIGGSDIVARAGDLTGGFGVSMADVSLAMLLMEQADGTGYAIQASGIPSLDGIAGGMLSAAEPMAIRINHLGRTIADEISNGVDSIPLNFDSAEAVFGFFLEDASLDLGDFGSITGNLGFSAAADIAGNATLTLKADGLRGSLPMGGGIGVDLTYGTADLALRKVGTDMEVTGSLGGSGQLTGISGLELSLSNLDLAVGGTGLELSGEAVLDLAGMVSMRGNLNLSQSVDQVSLVGGAMVDVERFTFTGTDLGLGISSGGDAAGLSITGADLAMTFMREAGLADMDTARRWISINAAPSQINLGGFVLEADQGGLLLNQALASVSGLAKMADIDWSGASVENIVVDEATTLAMDFAGQTWGFTGIHGELNLLGERLAGTFGITYDVANAIYTIDATDVSFTMQAGSAGVAVTNGSGSLTITGDGIAGTIGGTVALSGLTGVTFAADSVSLSMNTTGGLLEGIAAGTPFLLKATNATLGIDGFTQLSGDFAIERRLADGVAQLLIGGQNMAATLGDPAGLGVAIDDGQLAMVIQEVAGSTEFALDALGTLHFNGITANLVGDNLNGAVRINHLGRTVSEAVNTGGGYRQLSFVDAVDVESFAAENVHINLLDGYLDIAGDFVFQHRVDAQGNVLLEIAVADAHGQLKVPGDVGIELANGTLGLLIKNPADPQYAFVAHGDVTITGLEGFGLDLQGLGVDFAFNGFGIDLDYTFDVPSLDIGPIDLTLGALTDFSLKGMLDINLGGLFDFNGFIDLSRLRIPMPDFMIPGLDLFDPGFDLDFMLQYNFSGLDVDFDLGIPGIPDWKLGFEGLDFAFSFSHDFSFDPNFDFRFARQWFTLAGMMDFIHMGPWSFAPDFGLDMEWFTFNWSLPPLDLPDLPALGLPSMDWTLDWGMPDFGSFDLGMDLDWGLDLSLDFGDMGLHLPTFHMPDIDIAFDMFGLPVLGDFSFDLIDLPDLPNLPDMGLAIDIGNLDISLDFDGFSLDLFDGFGDFLFTPLGLAFNLDFSADIHIPGLDFDIPSVNLQFNPFDFDLDLALPDVGLDGLDLHLPANLDFAINLPDLSINIADFASLTGDFSLERRVVDGVQKLLLGANDVVARVGDLQGGVGLEVQSDNLALLVQNGADGTPGFALTASGVPGLIGMDGWGLSDDVGIKLNTLGLPVDEVVRTGGTPVNLQFASSADVKAFEVKNATLSLPGGAGSLTGDFVFSSSSTGNGVDANGDGLDDIIDTELVIAAANLTGNLDVGGGLGADLAGGSAAILLLGTRNTVTATDTSRGWALATSGDVNLSGMGGVGVTGTDLNVLINTTGQALDREIVVGDRLVTLQGSAAQELMITGEAELTVDGLLTASGWIGVEKTATQVTTATGEVVAAGQVVISAAQVDAWLGLDGAPGAVGAMGLALNHADFVLAVVDADADNRAWQAVKVRAGSASLVGLPADVHLTATNLSFGVNRAINTADVVDWSEVPLSIPVGNAPLTVDFNGDLGELFAGSGNFGVDMAQFAGLKGQLDIVKKSGVTATLSDGATQAMTAITLSGSGVQAFVGIHGPVGSADAAGFLLDGVAFNAALLKPSDLANTGFYYGLAASATSGAILGLDGFALPNANLTIAVNSSANAAGKVINFATTNINGLTLATPSMSAGGTLTLGLDGVADLSGTFTISTAGTLANPELRLYGTNISAAIGPGSLTGGTIGLVIAADNLGSPAYALSGSGTVNVTGAGDLHFVGEVGVQVNTLGRAINTAVNGVDVIFATGERINALDVGNLDVSLTGFLADTLDSAASTVIDLANDFKPGNLSDSNPMGMNIPGIDKNLAEILSVGDILALGDYVHHYLAPYFYVEQNLSNYVPDPEDDLPVGQFTWQPIYSDGLFPSVVDITWTNGPTLTGLVDFLRTQWIPTLPGLNGDNLKVVLSETGINVLLQGSVTQNSTIDFSLGDEAAEFGLSLDGDIQLDLSMVADLDLGFSFNWATGVSNFEVNKLGFKINGLIDDLATTATFGPVALGIGSVADPGRIEVDLRGSASLVNGQFQVNPAQDSVTADLPIFAALAGVDLADAAGTARVLLEGSPLSGGALHMDTVNFDRLMDFSNLSVVEVILMFPDMITFLQDVRDNQLAADIPFTQDALDAILDLGKGFKSEIYDKINFYRDPVNLLPQRADLVVHADSKTVTSALGGFTAALVGQQITIDGVGRYTIRSVTNATTLVLNKAIDASANGLTFTIHNPLEQIETMQELVSAINESGILPLGMQVTYDPVTNIFAVPMDFVYNTSVSTSLDFDLGLGDTLEISSDATGTLMGEIGGTMSLFVDIDGETLKGTDGRSTSGSRSFSSTLSTFKNSMVGYRLEIGDETYRVTSVNNAHTVTLDRAASQSYSGTVFSLEQGLVMGFEDISVTAAMDFDITDPAITARVGFVGLTAGGVGSGSAIHAGATATLALDRGMGLENDQRFAMDDILGGALGDAFDFSIDADAYAIIKGLSMAEGGVAGGFPISDTVEISLRALNLLDMGDTTVVTVNPNQAVDMDALIAAGTVAANDLVVILPDLGAAFDFSNLSFLDIVGAAREGISFLQDALQDQAFYEFSLPVVNVSLADTLSVTDELLARIEEAASNPESAIQNVETVFEEALGIQDNNALDWFEQKFALVLDGDALKIHMDYSKVFSDMYNFGLDLEVLMDAAGIAPGALDGLGFLTDMVRGGAGISLDAYAELVVDSGIRFAGLADPEFFLYDYDTVTHRGTHAEIGVRVEGSNLELGFDIGLMKLGVDGGSLILDADGIIATEDYATVTLALNQKAGTPNDDGRFHFATERFSDNMELLSTAKFAVNLPVALDIAGLHLALPEPLKIVSNPAWGDRGLLALMDGLAGEAELGALPAIVIQYPDIAGTFENLMGDYSILGLINSPERIIDGIDFGLGAVQDIFGNAVTQDIPLVGDSLGEVATFIQDMRTGLLAELRAKLSDSGGGINITRDALFKVFGPSGLKLMLDANHDGRVTVDDITGGWYDKSGHLLEAWTPGGAGRMDADAVQLQVKLGGSLYSTGMDLPLDFSIPGFELNVDGGFGMEVGWSFDFGLGLSVTDGFYLVDDLTKDELQAGVSFFLDSAPTNPNVTTPFNATGDLLFFRATLTDTDADPNKSGFQPHGMFGGLSVDFNGNERGRLTLNDIGARDEGAFDISFGLDTHLDMDVTLEVPDVGGLPTLKGNLVMDWDWDLLHGADKPTINLERLRLDVGSMVDDFLLPIADRISSTLEPMRPVIDALTAEIPGLDIIVSPANVMNLINLGLQIQGKAPIDWSFVYAAEFMLDLPDEIRSWGDDGEILLGDIYNLGTKNIRVESPWQDQAVEASGALLDKLNAVQTGSSGGQSSSNGGSGKTARGGFKFMEYITDIGNWMNIMTGGDATLFTYEMPLLTF